MFASGIQGSGIQAIARGLDLALSSLKGISAPPGEIRRVESELADALTHLYRAQASQAEHAMFQTECSAALEAARRIISALEHQAATDEGAAATVALVDRALRDLMSLRRSSTDEPTRLSRPREKKPPLRASVGEPRLLDLSRSVICPSIPVFAPPEGPPPFEAPEVQEPPPVTSLEELDALLRKATLAAEEDSADEGDSGQTKEVEKRETDQPADKKAPPPEVSNEIAEHENFGIALAEEEIVFGRASACLVDLGMLGLMRRPLDGQSWTGRQTAERRLLARVDAIVSFGEAVLPRLVKLLEDRPLPDPELTWAILFLFGSIAGDDALDQAMRVAHATTLDTPEMVDAIGEALSLAPHPGIAHAMREWLRDPAAERRAVAVKVLGRRRELTAPEATTAARDRELIVLTAAARALGNVEGSVDFKLIQDLLHHESEEIVRVALESSILLRTGLGVSRARALAAEDQPEMAQSASVLGIATDQREVDLFREMVSKLNSPSAIRAAGWFGHPQLIEPLLNRLRNGNETVKSAAIEALQRITGASLTDDDPDPAYENDDLPFLRSFAPPAFAAQLSTKAEIWAAWWKKHQPNCKMSQRFRYGHAWSAKDNLWEMEDALSSRGDRWTAYLELVARTGETIAFDPDSFVARQRRQISEWRSFLGARGSSSGFHGAWPLRLRG